MTGMNEEGVGSELQLWGGGERLTGCKKGSGLSV